MKKSFFILFFTTLSALHSFSQVDLYDEIMPKITNSYIEKYRITLETSSDKYCIGLDTSSIAVIDLNSMKVVKSISTKERKIAEVIFGFNDSIIIATYCNGTVDIYNWTSEKLVTSFYASVPCQSSKMAQYQVRLSPEKKYLYQHYCGFPKFIVNLQNGKRFPKVESEELNSNSLFFDEKNNKCFINNFSEKDNRILDLKSNSIIYTFNNKNNFNNTGIFKKSSNKIMQVLQTISKQNSKNDYNFFEIKLWDFKNQIFNQPFETISIADTIGLYGLSTDLKKAFFYSSYSPFEEKPNKYYYYDLTKKNSKLISINLPNCNKTQINDYVDILDSIIIYRDSFNNLNIYSVEKNRISLSFKNVLNYKIKNQFLAITNNNNSFDLYDIKNSKILFSKTIGKSIYKFNKDGTLLFLFDNESINSKRDYDNLYNYEILNKIERIFNLVSLKETVL